MKAKIKLKDKKDKVGFLLGLSNGTRSINELIELETVFLDKEKFEKAKSDPRYDGETIFFIPPNGRN